MTLSAAWPVTCPGCGAQLPADLYRCLYCRKLLNSDSVHNQIHTPAPLLQAQTVAIKEQVMPQPPQQEPQTASSQQQFGPLTITILSKKSTWLAAYLEVFIPGAGLAYAGNVPLALLSSLVTIVGIPWAFFNWLGIIANDIQHPQPYNTYYGTGGITYSDAHDFFIGAILVILTTFALRIMFAVSLAVRHNNDLKHRAATPAVRV